MDVNWNVQEITKKLLENDPNYNINAKIEEGELGNKRHNYRQQALVEITEADNTTIDERNLRMTSFDISKICTIIISADDKNEVLDIWDDIIEVIKANNKEGKGQDIEGWDRIQFDPTFGYTDLVSGNYKKTINIVYESRAET